MNIQKTTHLIQEWAVERNLHTADPRGQMLKLMEEVGEIAAALARKDIDEVMDGIGDVGVVINILATQVGSSIEECMELAYNEIKDRKGKMVNGVFVKEADLKTCPHGDNWDDCPDCRH
ncbi:MazG-like family protein [Sporosarcina sp. A2]|uniref:MazG-like family protein n=1 Tax=Sporosarcina sp. A2 TaxID=3393449 RepID=UPI003D7C08DF